MRTVSSSLSTSSPSRFPGASSSPAATGGAAELSPSVQRPCRAGKVPWDLANVRIKWQFLASTGAARCLSCSGMQTTPQSRALVVDWDNLPGSEYHQPPRGRWARVKSGPSSPVTPARQGEKSPNTPGHIWAGEQELGILKAGWCSRCLFTARSPRVVAIPA